jgi:hypothetical protein
MPSVSVNMPKTPCTKGSNTIAAATVPNICKMPGPPAPFVPTPLPNIGKSGLSPHKDFSKTVKIEGNDVAIKGSSFGSMGDIASKGLGGGLVSMNCEGPTTWVAPGSLNSKIEGKNIQLLGDQMLNNNGPSGNPPNAACMMGALHGPGSANPLVIKCTGAPASNPVKFTPCEIEQICEKCKDINKQAKAKKLRRRSAASQKKARAKGNTAARKFKNDEVKALKTGAKTPDDIEFTAQCAADEWKKAGADKELKGFSADHVHEIQVGGCPTSPSNLRLMSSNANEWIGNAMSQYNKKKKKNTGVAPDCCPP